MTNNMTSLMPNFKFKKQNHISMRSKFKNNKRISITSIPTIISSTTTITSVKLTKNAKTNVLNKFEKLKNKSDKEINSEDELIVSIYILREKSDEFECIFSIYND
jgi:hypothetical protein